MVAPITQKHLYGWKMEKILLPHLENYIQEPITPTTYRFDGLDAKSENTDNEIKARPKYSVKYRTLQTKDTYSDWLMPCCKADKKSNKKLYFFYYWGHDKELFVCEYTAEKAKKWKREVPFWSKQEHFFIPKSEWTLLKSDISDEGAE